MEAKTSPFLPGLDPLRENSLGIPEICVAVLDGPVDLAHPCFQGANLRRVATLAHDPAGTGRMSAHGTHVASVIFGQPGGPVKGIAPRCRGLVLTVFRDEQEVPLSQIDLARAIERAVEEGANIINISGGELSPKGQADAVLERAVRLCAENRVLVVAAAGNDGCECLHVPAALASVLAVGAMGTDGEPLEISNWGDAYRSKGVLAPGENIPGAIPGGGTAQFTGSSFATPIVSGIAALLLSVERQNGREIDPLAAGEIILRTARPCRPRDSPECVRYLAGVLNIPGAYDLIQKGGKKIMSDPEANPITSPSAAAAVPAESTAASSSGASMVASGVEPSGQSAPAGSAAPPIASPGSSTVAEPSASPGVVPAGNCGCGGNNGRKQYIFAIGLVSYDFGTLARRDSFQQLMRAELGPTANPYNPIELCNYLDDNISESTKLIWTLNLESSPVYAIEAEPAYADEVYGLLRSALRGESQPPVMPNQKGFADYERTHVSRVSIPGVLTNRTVRLFSGQVVPIVVAQHRGMYAWHTELLTKAVIEQIQAQNKAQRPAVAMSSDDVRNANTFVHNYLNKLYFQLRNLGQSSPDRALNFSATNAFQVTETMVSAINPVAAGLVPKPTDHMGLYTLDTVSVSKSPYCRFDSDCWDVHLVFFDPVNVLQARLVFQFTIDVSDEMPVTLGPIRKWTQGQSSLIG